MNANTIVERSISLIALGLIRREQISEKKSGYIPCPEIAQGAAMFLAFACNEGGQGFEILDFAHERAFMEEYATKPVKDWFKGFDKALVDRIRKTVAGKVWECGALCVKIGDASSGFIFSPTDECYDLLYYWNGEKSTSRNKLIDNMDERHVYDLLVQLYEKEAHFYAVGREYIIKKPILFTQEDADLFLDQFRNNPAASDIARELLERAYESTEDLLGELFVCPTCGWIMSRNGKTAHCSTLDCHKSASSRMTRIKGGIFPRRLKLGVMKCICNAGKLESKIFDYLEGKCMYEKWPYRDTYDALITFPDGQKWVIDAKSWQNIHSLVKDIKRDGGMHSKIKYDRGFYVVDDIHKKADLALDGNLAGIPGCEKVQCVNLSGFKRELAKKLGAL